MTQPTRRIDYDRQTHDYAMFLDEQFIGFAATYHAAETTLDQVVADRLEWQARADRAAKLALVKQFSEAYLAAKAEGRELDMALYKRQGAELLAELGSVTTDELEAVA